MTYIEKNYIYNDYADEYAGFMINTDKNADSMFNTENFKYSLS